jgi:dsRNA-specific ribonuclease
VRRFGDFEPRQHDGTDGTPTRTMPERSSSWRTFPTPDEVTALTRANPKGCLLEFCARARSEPPEIAVERTATLSGAAMTLTVGGRTFESGMHWAAERMTAEQLAARALLEALAQTEDDAEPGEWVTEEDEGRLRRENPKGALLERCIRLRLTPRFEVRPVVTPEGAGFEASAFVERADGEDVWSALRRACQAKTAEQAAAESLLHRLTEEAPGSPALVPSEVTSREPRSVLNELRQRGELMDYGFTLERVEGPPHAPVFHMKGFVERMGGARVEIAGVEAASKKEGERLVAQQLLQRL